MKTLNLLFHKNYLMFYNQYLESPKKKLKLAALILFLIAFFIGGSHIIAAKLFDPLTPDEMVHAKAIMQTMLFSFLMLFSVIQFFSSAISIIPDFYESADMQYLISTPIKASILLLYKLITHTLNVMKKESFIALPLIISAGFLTRPSWLFYVLMPFVYFFVVASSACFGIVVGMYMLNKMPIKRYKLIMSLGQNVFIGGIWLIYVFKWVNFDALMPLLNTTIFKGLLTVFFPPYAASHLLAGISFGLDGWFFVYAGAFAILITITIGGASLVANRYFYSGWMNNSITPKPLKRKKQPKNLNMPSNKVRTPLWCLVQSQWLSALKNYELLYPGLIMYGVYAAVVYGSIRMPDLSLDLRSIALFVAGFFFVNLGTAMPLMSSEISKNPKLEKQQYALFKTFPISSKKYMLFKLLSQGIPTFIIITLGFVIATLFTEMSLGTLILLLLLQTFFYIIHLIQNTSFLVIYYQKYYDSNKFLGNIISFSLSALFYTLSFGLYLASVFEWFILPLPLIASVVLAYGIFQIFFVFPLGVNAWAKTEF